MAMAIEARRCFQRRSRTVLLAAQATPSLVGGGPLKQDSYPLTRPRRRTHPEEPAVEVREAFFTLATKGIDFETVIPRWVEVNNRFRAAFDMILGLRYVKRGYLQTQLITAVAAAESVHAALKFGPPIPNSEFNALKKSLLNVVPDERRQWLREKLGQTGTLWSASLPTLRILPTRR